MLISLKFEHLEIKSWMPLLCTCTDFPVSYLSASCEYLVFANCWWKCAECAEWQPVLAGMSLGRLGPGGGRSSGGPRRRILHVMHSGIVA